MTSLKKRLEHGEHVLGSFAFIANPDVVEIMGVAGFDFLVIDAEHTAPDWEVLRNMVRASELHGMAAIVRVPENNEVWIKHALESGAQGVMVPFIQTAEDVEEAYAATMYPPQGRRGVCPLTRPAGYGINRLAFDSMSRNTNDNTILIGIVEDKRGMDNLEAIASTSPGLDVVFLGRSDLAASLGVPGQRNHPAVETHIQRAADVLARSNGPGHRALGGMQVHDGAELDAWITRGFRVLSISSDATLLGEAGRQVVVSAKQRRTQTLGEDFSASAEKLG